MYLFRHRKCAIDIADSRLDKIHNRLNAMRVGRRVISRLQRSRYRPTSFVPQNHKQPCVQMDSRVLDTAQHIVSDHISGDPDDKEVPQTLVKYEFNGNPGVAAAQHDGEWVLTRYQLVP